MSKNKTDFKPLIVSTDYSSAKIEVAVSDLRRLHDAAMAHIDKMLKAIPRTKLSEPGLKQVADLMKTVPEFTKELDKMVKEGDLHSAYGALLANRSLYLQIMGSLLDMYSIFGKDADELIEFTLDHAAFSRSFINSLEIRKEQERIKKKMAKMGSLANFQKAD